MRAKPIDPPTLVVTREGAAKITGLSVQTIDRAIARGDLVARKYHQRTLILRSDVERFLCNLSPKSPSIPQDVPQ